MKKIDSNKLELNDHIMHWVLPKYGNTNSREYESLIDIIVDDVWKIISDQVWNKFPEVAATVVPEQAKDIPESSKRKDQDIRKIEVSKLVATEAIGVDEGLFLHAL
ncbi:hypothetical protein Tco_0940754 [Tanacetum coccineum]|uniref:Uncharacterized protein n=1 Tax=Tanacetum coccineum TaxID=301880 RepID=A0ABQ5DUY8_9ASTR